MSLLQTLKNAVGVKSRPAPAPAFPTPAPRAATSLPGPHRAASPLRPGASAPAAAPGKVERRLLFVGCDENWFQQVQRDLLQLELSWHCLHVPQPAEAQPLLGAQPLHALVMAWGLNGQKELLHAVEIEQPNSLRLILCDPAQLTGRGLEWPTGVTPLANTLDTATLTETLLRQWRVQEWMSGFSMKNLFARMRKLPTIPRLHSQVTQELQSPHGSLEMVAECIRQDPVMTAKFLQVVNSAAFGLASPITDPGTAVLFLGAERTRALILMAGVFSQFANTRCPRFSLEEVWNHSLRVGSLARGLTLLETEDAALAELAFTAGLLHEIGQIVLAANLPEMWNAVEISQRCQTSTLREVELVVLGTTHAKLGGCLLGTWGLPLRLVEAVAWHDWPSSSEDWQFSVLTAVHVANVFALESGQPQTGGDLSYRLDLPYLVRLGLGQQPNAWRQTCGLPTKTETEGL